MAKASNVFLSGLLILTMCVPAFAQMSSIPEPDKVKGFLDIGTIEKYGGIFFGFIVGAVVVYTAQSFGRLPVPTKAVKTLQDALDKEREQRQRLEVALASLKATVEAESKARQEMDRKIAEITGMKNV